MQRYNINNRLAYLSGGLQSHGGMWPSAGAGDWTPASATTSGGVSPVFWYNAGDIVGLSNGDAVTNWADSANSYDLGAHTFGSLNYYTGIINGEPVVRFGGSQIAYEGTQPIAATDPRTIFIVSIPTATTSGSQPFSLGVNNGTGKVWLITSEVAIRTSSVTWVSSTPASTSVASILVGRYSSGNLHTGGSMRLNGSDVTRTSGTDGAINTTGTHIVLGGTYNGSAYVGLFTGDLAEIVGYEAALSTADIDQVEAYLASKYNITI